MQWLTDPVGDDKEQDKPDQVLVAPDFLTSVEAYVSEQGLAALFCTSQSGWRASWIFGHASVGLSASQYRRFDCARGFSGGSARSETQQLFAGLLSSQVVTQFELQDGDGDGSGSLMRVVGFAVQLRGGQVARLGLLVHKVEPEWLPAVVVIDLVVGLLAVAAVVVLVVKLCKFKSRAPSPVSTPRPSPSDPPAAS
jgi:hypothetical protein